MKRLFLILLILMALAAPGSAQNFEASGTITAQSSGKTDCASTNCVRLSLPTNPGAVAIQLAGTFSGTW